MLHAFYLISYVMMILCSAYSAWHGDWQQAIWILFFLSVFQNMVTQFKVLEK